MAKKPKVYLDSCCFIELARVEIGAGDPLREKDCWCLNAMLQARRNEHIEILTSTLSIAECLHADGATTDDIRSLFRKLLTSGTYVILVQDNIVVAEKARDLLWVHEIRKIKGADAIHVASAMQYGCDVFVTFDKGMHDKAPELDALGLDVMYPRDYIQKLPAKYKQRSIEEADIPPAPPSSADEQ